MRDPARGRHRPGVGRSVWLGLVVLVLVLLAHVTLLGLLPRIGTAPAKLRDPEPVIVRMLPPPVTTPPAAPAAMQSAQPARSAKLAHKYKVRKTLIRQSAPALPAIKKERSEPPSEPTQDATAAMPKPEDRDSSGTPASDNSTSSDTDTDTGGKTAATAPQEPISADALPGLAPPPVRLAAPVRMELVAKGEAKGLTYHANSEFLWQHDGEHYQLSLTVSAFFIGALTQTSSGQIDASGLLPERFSDKRGRRSEQTVVFDRADGRIVFNSAAPPLALEPGMQDRLSLFMQMGAWLAGDPARYPAGSGITVQAVGTQESEPWVFVVEPPELLDLPSGSVQTVRLARAPRKPQDTRVEVWYAPLLGYLPVRIRITQASGDYVDQQLESLGPP